MIKVRRSIVGGVIGEEPEVKNLGWRIDYHVITEEARPRLNNAAILSEINFSDHCPVVVEMSF
jgi:Exonuclease III